LILLLRDQAGHTVRFPCRRIVPAENGRDMILTLCTPQGLAVSFTVKPWQVEVVGQSESQLSTYPILCAVLPGVPIAGIDA
jgi:hypothetical protein